MSGRQRMSRAMRSLTVTTVLLASADEGGKKASQVAVGEPQTRIVLSSYGLPTDYAKHDTDSNCTSHVIGYRSVIWLTANLVSVVFNASPACRLAVDAPMDAGVARVLAFGVDGKLGSQRDIPYQADGREEVVADGDAFAGPENSLIFRIEEVGRAKSGILQLDDQLKDVARIDRFLETGSVVDHALAFQEGFVSHGPRTYDVFDGNPLGQVHQFTEDWPAGTMDRKVGGNGVMSMLCQQELKPNTYSSTNMIYSGAHRRCTLTVEDAVHRMWQAQLGQDEVAELVGQLPSGDVLGIVRAPKTSERLVLWSAGKPAEVLPWFPAKYEGKLQSAVEKMSRYQGYGEPLPTGWCAKFGIFCHDDADGKLMIFNRSMQRALVDRAFPRNARAAISPDGLRYATFENGELRIYTLAGAK